MLRISFYVSFLRSAFRFYSKQNNSFILLYTHRHFSRLMAWPIHKKAFLVFNILIYVDVSGGAESSRHNIVPLFEYFIIIERRANFYKLKLPLSLLF